MDSKVGLIIQLSGVCLITLLTLFLRQTVKVEALRHWTHAWLFLSFSLFCLRLASSFDGMSMPLFSLYFVNQYIFGYLLIAGCRSIGARAALTTKYQFLLVPFLLLALCLPWISGDVSFVLNVHSAVTSTFFVLALVELWRSRVRSFGWKVMFVAVTLLTLNFSQIFLFSVSSRLLPISSLFFEYNSIVDLVLEVMLGFGMVIVLLELVLSDAKVANENLKRAQQRLEELAHIDPLTTALNRHAFHGYLAQHDGAIASGTVGFFDIDDLKSINDRHGHAAGDASIRLVVKSIREIIRPEDLIFRWGGDEFFVLMIGIDARAAADRMSVLERKLTNIMLQGTPLPLTIGVSHAFEDFADLDALEMAIERADAKMYVNKQDRKELNGGQIFSPSVVYTTGVSN